MVAPAPAPVAIPVVVSAGWLTNVPAHWAAEVSDDGTIQLQGERGTLIAARGAGDCDELVYPAPVGELEYGDLDAITSDPWNLKIGYIVDSGSDVYCRDLGDGQVMVIVAPALTDPAEVLDSVEPIA